MPLKLREISTSCMHEERNTEPEGPCHSGGLHAGRGSEEVRATTESARHRERLRAAMAQQAGMWKELVGPPGLGTLPQLYSE